MGLHHPFIFQNYARYDQDVFAGYGLENRKRLQEIQKKYDPDGVFSRLQPGYFKV
jgi:FAD/FMN-containing dehydrogenase